MKTPRIFIMKITLRLGVAALLALLFTPSSSNALEGPYSNVKEIGPYLGDPEEPSSPVPTASYFEDPASESVAEPALKQARQGKAIERSPWSQLIHFLQLARFVAGR